MLTESSNLWHLTRTRIHIDPHDLTAALEEQIARNDLDYRSRVLIRDSVKALRNYWGEDRLTSWLETSPWGEEIEAICQGPWDDDRGFSSLMRRVMDVVKPDTIHQYFRELSQHVRKPLQLHIGGSVALILPGHLSRPTEDIDVVDEVPAELRTQHKVLDDLKSRYGLELAHFQRHYLPMGWEQRTHSQSSYGPIQIALVDIYDVFLSKLYSARTKDLDDLRLLEPKIDKDTLIRKLKETTQSMLVAPGLREKATKNWNILYGEDLPA